MAFVPEYLEAHVIVYRVSKVALAHQRWQDFAPEIEAALAAVNGRGLPAGYELEEDPAAWDEFDLFVVGYTWARLDEGNPQPRLAMRSRSYWPSVDALVERNASRSNADDLGPRAASPRRAHLACSSPRTRSRKAGGLGKSTDESTERDEHHSMDRLGLDLAREGEPVSMCRAAGLPP
jgi:hypothetical protein